MTVHMEPRQQATRGDARSPQKLLGLFSGTLVAVEDGWSPVETLTPGTRVWTFDNGLQTIAEIKARAFAEQGAGAGLWQDLFVVPAGGLSNEQDLLLLPDVGLLLECENAQDQFGDPFAVLPIAVLEGICGIKRGCEPQQRTLFQVRFEREEVVYIDSGILVHCPIADTMREQTSARYDVKTIHEGQKLLTDLDLAMLALREPDEDFRMIFEDAATELTTTG